MYNNAPILHKMKGYIFDLGKLLSKPKYNYEPDILEEQN